MIHIGLDVGSTTVKVVVMNEKLNTLFSSYQRHFSDTRKTIYEALDEIIKKYADKELTIALTGSRCTFCIYVFRYEFYSRSNIM